MTKITIPDTADLLAAREEAYARGYHDAQERGITSWRLVIQDSPELAALRARIAELEAELAEADALIKATWADMASNKIRLAETTHRADRAEAKLREIITDATSREHALTIAREGLE